MSEEVSEFDPPASNGDVSNVPPERVSRLHLVVGILVMLLPAGVPLYFAFQTDGAAAVWLMILAAVIALMNTALVYGIWSWVNSLNSP